VSVPSKVALWALEIASPGIGMLGRMLRSMLSVRGRTSSERPTLEQARLLNGTLSALAAGDVARLTSMLSAIARAGPPCAELHRTLGSELGRSGRLDLARAQLEAAVALDATHAGAWTDLGNVHRLSGRSADAQRCYRHALTLDPSAAAVSVGLASLEIDADQSQAGIARLRAVIAASAFPDAVEMLAQLLDRLDRSEEAKAMCREVLIRHPAHGAAHAALGYILLKREFRSEEALVHFDQALSAGYRSEQLHSNRGIALQDLGRLDAAITSYDAALALSPGHPLARFHRGLARLMRGEFDDGWPDYEMRHASTDRQAPPRELPVWDGSPTSDSLLVYGEQGIGDEIMFASCIPDLLHRCPHVVLACTPKLEVLFRRSFPQAEVIALALARDASAGAGAARRMIAIGSLPLHLRRSRSEFPDHRGYLQADPGRVAEYRERLHVLGPGMKVGLSWRGGTNISRRALRSLDLDQLQPLLALPDVRFVNLQYDGWPGTGAAWPIPAAGELVHWQDALDDYDRTAALVASLDVVVSVCTAVIHLAGALGKSTLVMAPYSPEWRYGIAAAQMPWYPAVRVERQSVRGDWTPVIEAVRSHIAQLSTCVVDR